MARNENDLFPRIISVMVIVAASAAFMVAICHCIVDCLLKHRRNNAHSPRRLQAFSSEQGETLSNIENSTMQFITAHKFQKGVGLAGEDGTCAICLSEFEEGEELRTLPKCMHSFHVHCIDMWLRLHSNCPMCRTSEIFVHSLDSGSGEPEVQQEPSVLPDVQSGEV